MDNPSGIEWTKAQIIHLIQLYRARPALWDPDCNGFKDKNHKNVAWREIAQELQLNKYELQLKMKCLTGQFRRESKKVATGGGTSKWYAYDALAFLEQVRYRDVDVKPGKEPMDIPLEEHLTGLVRESRPSRESNLPLVQSPSPSLSSGSCRAQQMPPLKKISKGNIKARDDLDVFGEDVACQLRNITDLRLRLVAKQKINTVLFQAQMSQITNIGMNSSTNATTTDEGTSVSNSRDYLVDPHDFLEQNLEDENI